MQTLTWTRREVAEELGLTYSTLRVYERHLGDLLELSQGANRTTLYGSEALELMKEAVELKRQGLPFAKLVQYFRGELAPGGPGRPTLDSIHEKTEALLNIGRRLEEKLRVVEERISRRLTGGELVPAGAGNGGDHV